MSRPAKRNNLNETRRAAPASARTTATHHPRGNEPRTPVIKSHPVPVPAQVRLQSASAHHPHEIRKHLPDLREHVVPVLPLERVHALTIPTLPSIVRDLRRRHERLDARLPARVEEERVRVAVARGGVADA